MTRRPRWVRIGDWLSAGWNVLIHNGESGESTSGRSYREGALEDSPEWLKRMQRIDRVFSALKIETEHCRRAHEADIERAAGRLEYSSGSRNGQLSQGVR